MNNQEKNYRDFCRQLDTINTKHVAIANSVSTFKEQLFEEFIQTELRPDLKLFTLSFLTEKEINEGLASGYTDGEEARIKRREIEDKLAEIDEEFYKQVSKRTLDKVYFSFDLNNTKTVKTLKRIEEETRSLQTFPINNHDMLLYDRYAEAFAHSLSTLIKRLNNSEVVSKVSEELLEYDEIDNISAIAFIYGYKNDGYLDRYELLKRLFNLHFTKLLPLEKSSKETKTIKKTDGLSKRQNMLIYCYEGGLPLATVDKNYQLYIELATPRKRIGFPNESEKRRNYFIKDIEKILPCLSLKARQQAEGEIVILKSQN